MVLLEILLQYWAYQTVPQPHDTRSKPPWFEIKLEPEFGAYLVCCGSVV